MIEYQEMETNQGLLRLYNSFKPYRLKSDDTGGDEETQAEYKMRRSTIKAYNKARGKKIHVSTMLIPAMDEEGNFLLDYKGNPVYLGQTKGVTYRKNDERKEEHMGVLEHLKQLKEDIENGDEKQ